MSRTTKKVAGCPLLVLGIALVLTGYYAINRGFDGRDLIRASLVEQEITTPAEASIPNEPVTDAATAASMAAYIDDVLEGPTGGRNFNEIGPYLTATGKDTANPAEAALASDGMPMENPIRAVAFEASTAKTGLMMSVVAFNLTDVAIGLGAFMILGGLAMSIGGAVLVGLKVPTFSRRPATAGELVELPA